MDIKRHADLVKILERDAAYAEAFEIELFSGHAKR